ncbi:MAG: hypothetical protein GX061_08300 [Eubacteriaceae bacterium]|jgi:polyhydroxyalkanoate synthesis regulator phasin|nr:hypothetical protein [Eubacteriaceae bacterium]
MNKKDVEDIRSVIENLRMSETEMDSLKNEVNRRGLEGEIAQFTKKYSNQINEIVKNAGKAGNMSNEQKTQMVMDLQDKLSPSQQKQFKTILSALKNYMKKK